MRILPNVFHVIGGNHAFVSDAVACEPPQWFDFLDNHEDLSFFEWQIFVVLRSIDDQVRLNRHGESTHLAIEFVLRSNA